MSEINESNEAKRQRLLGIENDSKIHDENEVITKTNKLANFWFNHKWKVIIIASIAIILTIGIIWMVQRPKYDIELAYFGPVYMQSQQFDDVTAALTDVMDDFDGDGQKLINLVPTTYQGQGHLENTTENKELFGQVLTEQANIQALESMNYQLASGQICLFIIDKDIYEKEYKGSFAPLTEIFGQRPDSAYDGYSIDLSKTQLTKKYPATEDIFKDCLICVRQNAVAKAESYEQAVALLKKIVEMK
ncbi:MAG: hypothetical protein IJ309_03645 [Clostridia bacterium]|nr:hypothetical protein [Clostridia bacterium]